MLNKIKELADEAIVLQNKDRMDAVLREISAMLTPEAKETDIYISNFGMAREKIERTLEDYGTSVSHTFSEVADGEQFSMGDLVVSSKNGIKKAKGGSND